MSNPRRHLLELAPLDATELMHLLDLADFIGSTSGLLRRAEASTAQSFIVLTEPGILHQMRLKVPNKAFYEVPGADGCSCNACPYMRLNTLKKCGSASI